MAKKPDAVLPDATALSRLRPKRKPGGRPFPKGQIPPGAVPFTGADDPRRFAGTRRAAIEFKKLCEGSALSLLPHLESRVRAGRIVTAQVQHFRAVAEHAGFASVTRVEHTGRGGGPIKSERVLDVSDLTVEELELAIRLNEKAKDRDDDVEE